MMLSKKYQKIITIDPLVANGEPCIRGLPITVKEIAHRVTNQTPLTQILIEYPGLTIEDLKACMSFLADQPIGVYLNTLS